jgi:hypothetical protein
MTFFQFDRQKGQTVTGREVMGEKRPSVLGALIAKEVHDLVLTLRFTVGTILTLALAVLAAYIGSLDYNARLDSYQTKLQLNREDLSKTAVYSFLQPTVVRPPEPLSILNHGLEGRLGTDVGIRVNEENTEATGENRGNEYLSIFSAVDLTVVVAVILGLLALLFTFDAVCGEREAGMLKLMMSYPLSRSELLLGKFAGAWITLMIPTAMACLFSLLVIGFVGHVNFGAQELLRIGLLFALYGAYLSLMLLVGLVISSFFQRSSIALVFSTFAWFFFVTIVPNLATMIPDFVGDRASVYQTARENLTQLNKEEGKASDKLKDPRDFDPKKEPTALFYYAINNNWGGSTAFECHFGAPRFYDQVRDYFEQRIPLAEKYAAARADVWRRYLRYRDRQARLARGLAFLSPSAVFQNAETFVCGTSEADYNHYIALASQYRDTFLGYLMGKGAFSSWRWFTGDPDDGDKPWTILAAGKTPDEMAATGEDPMTVLNNWSHDQVAWARFIQIEQDRPKNPNRYLSLADLPTFIYRRLATGAALVSAAPEIAYLLGLNLILFFVAFMRFANYDVR